MLTIKLIREKTQEVIDKLKVKNFEAEEIINDIIKTDDLRKELQQKKDSLQSHLNEISKSIGQLIAKGETLAADEMKIKTSQAKEQIKELEINFTQAEEKLNKLLIQLPNIPHASVPKGFNETDNQQVYLSEEVAILNNEKAHWEIIKELDIIDFELGNKITAAGFPVYKGKGAKLQRALISFFLDKAGEAGYTEIQPPLLVNEASGFGTGNLPDKEGQMYYIGLDDLYLIPTAEIPITNLYRDIILSEKDFPIKNVAYSACFRREAGSYGADVRGLNRLHQFDKVEIVQIQSPEKSYIALEEMKEHVESLLKKLNLPYRILKLCGGDISFTSALTFDFEVFSAGQKKWLEVSSVSNFEDFQANRLKLRYKAEKDKKTRLAHTLNGSALALPRIMAALIENNYNGSEIIIPEILIPYTGFKTIS